MNKFQVAVGIIAVAERDKPTSVASKKRAGTRRAGFKVSRDGIEHAVAHSIDMSRKPAKPPVQTIGEYGPKQSIRIWRNK